jgi:hypothetical protein
VVGAAAAVVTGVVEAEVVDTIRLVEAGQVVTIRVAAWDIIHLLVEAVEDIVVHVEAAAAEAEVVMVVMVVVAPIVHLRVPVPAPVLPGEHVTEQYSFELSEMSYLHFGFGQIITTLFKFPG